MASKANKGKKMDHNQASEYLNVHRNTLRRWRKSFGLPHHKKPNGRPIYYQHELDQWNTIKPGVATS